MVRQGKYTKKVSWPVRVRRSWRRSTRWFRKLSRPKKVLVLASPLLAFLIITPLVTYAYYYNDISDQERLMNRNNTGVVLLSSDGKPFYSIGRAEKRTTVALADISPYVPKALIAAEDKSFYEHGGFSVLSILKALYGNILAGDLTAYGGSTITQQLAKNTLLRSDRTFLRKYQEIIVATAIEQQYGKDEILGMYLNSVYFGANAFGIHEAAQTYFHKSPKDLDLAESSMLIGLLPAPTAYSPLTGDAELAKKQQSVVLARMIENGFISRQEGQTALARPLRYAEFSDVNSSTAPHFAEMVMQELYDRYGEEKVNRSGFQVRTTLNLNLQNELKDSIDAHLGYINALGGSNAAGVVIEPTSGRVLALVGSADWNNPDWGQVNLATTPRQPGSSFKPIYYARALADGVINPATILHDVPTDFNGYRPLNADRSFRGNISVRSALSQSLNVPSVEVMEKLGVDKAVATARSFDIPLSDERGYGLSLALGAAEAPLLNMTSAYAALANQGQKQPVGLVDKINDKFDQTIYEYQTGEGKRAVSAQGAYLVSDILSDGAARAPIFGSSLSIYGHTVAVKTGTTDEARDAWTIGYTPDITVGIWVGNNDNKPMLSGGADMAGPIWRSIMRAVLASQPDKPFPMPSDIVIRPVCYGQEALATRSGYGTYNEKFLLYALPKATCSPVSPPEEKEDKKPVDNKKPQPKPQDTNQSADNPTDSTTETTPNAPDGTTNPNPSPIDSGAGSTGDNALPLPPTSP